MAALATRGTCPAKGRALLASFLHASIVGHKKFSDALSYALANKLAEPSLSAVQLWELFSQAHANDRGLTRCALLDLAAVLERDPAVRTASQAFLYLKGFHALQAYRVAHILWRDKREALAYHLQNRIAEVLAVDIHPAAKMGHGIMLDHATGVVIGETTVVGNNVSMLHGVTLGGPAGKRATVTQKSATGFCSEPVAMSWVTSKSAQAQNRGGQRCSRSRSRAYDRGRRSGKNCRQIARHSW